VTVDVVTYDSVLGTGTWWDNDALLRAEVREAPEETVVISGNPAGLTSLARHLLTLAQDAVPDGSHFDFDSYLGWFEEGSLAIRIEVKRS
jgi:hypothetical protein